jgi:superfamily II DNA/RNA helicase
MSVSPFGALGVPADLIACLERAGISAPFPVQAAVIPDALAGRDVTGRAPTGSGKTLAFGVPVVANLAAAKPRRPTALVLAPTRELADQIATELRPLARARQRDVVAIYGGVGYGAQKRALDNGASLVVACPGRLEDLVQMGAVSLADVQQIVVDEADRMADMGFLPAVRRILGQTRAERQVLLFSATLDGAVGKLAGAVQRNPIVHEVGAAGPDVSAARHEFWMVERPDRAATTAALVDSLGSTIVFTRTRHGADRLARQLANLGVSAAPIHGGRSQPQRDRALKDFTTGNVAALVATDVAARGVHVDDVALVLHYDLPGDGATYVHRSGRTARAGASGVVVAFVERGAEKDVRTIQREAGITVDTTGADVASLGGRPVTARRSAPAIEVRPDRQDRQDRPEQTGTRPVADPNHNRNRRRHRNGRGPVTPTRSTKGAR